MIALRNFAVASISALGAMEVIEPQIIDGIETDPQTLLVRTLITVVAGLLTSLSTRFIKHCRQKKGNKIQKRVKTETKN